MSSEDKAMASRVTSLSPKAPVSEPDPNRMMMFRSNMEHSQTNGQSNAVLGPVAIFWDIENCPVPSDVRPEDVAGNVRMALRMHPVVRGAVTMLSAYGDFNAFPRRLREGCQRTGVKLVDVPNGRKDAADKAILVDMFLFALDNHPPSTIMLISGDVDFAPALHILGQRGYTIVIAIPSSVTVSSALSSAGSFVWDWPRLARGEGIVIPRSWVRRLADYPCYVNSGNVGQFPDNQNEEEAIVYTGTSRNEYSGRPPVVYTGTSRNEYGGRPPVNQMHCYNSFQTTREPSKALYTVEDGNCGTSRPHNLSCGQSGSTETGQGFKDEQSWWVRPGDLQGLKGQLIRLFELSGGCVPLVRIPSEYLKLFGRHLYVSEYGAVKLVHLFEKLADSFVVIGKGHRKMICLCNSVDRNLKNYSSTPIIWKKKNTGSSALEESTIGACQQLGSSSDDLSEDEPNINPDIDGASVFNDHLDSFRREIQVRQSFMTAQQAAETATDRQAVGDAQDLTRRFEELQITGNTAAAAVNAPGESTAQRLETVPARVHEVANQGAIIGASFALAAVFERTGLNLQDLEVTPQIADAIEANSEQFEAAAEALAQLASTHYIINRLP